MAPLTGIFGTNSSGKTAILQFLLMLKQTVESSDQNLVLNLGNERAYATLGTLYDILYQHKLPESLKYSLCWNSQKKTESVFLPANRTPSKEVFQKSPKQTHLISFKEYKSELRFSSCIAVDVNRIKVKEFYYQFKDERNELNQLGMKLINFSKEKLGYQIFRKGKLIEKISFLDEASSLFPKKGYIFPVHFPVNAAEVSISLVRAFENCFEQLYYLGPLREYPQRSYLWSGEEPQDVGKKGEFIASALLASRNNNLKIEDKIAFWLKKLGLIYSFKVQPIAINRSDYEIRVCRLPDSPEVLITDVGFGVSQILPVLILCYYVPEGSTIIFEQPEIHLHPSVQAGLADVFIDVIKTRNIQIILESHSEHLLRRLQRRIAEEHENMKPEDAALYFCSIDDTGTSKLTTLEIDTYGNINNWPQGFFGDEMGDILAMTEAAMRRQTANN